MPTIYAALDERLLIFRGQRGDWEATERLPATDLACVAADPAAPERAFVGTVSAGLQRTTDGGSSWTVVGEFADRGERVTSVLVAPHDPSVVYAGTEPSRIYRSTDAGESWTHLDGLTDLPSSGRWSFPPRPDTHHVRWLATAPDDPGHLYVGIEAGAIVRSPDAGETWLDHPDGAPRDPHTIATHPDAPDRVYVAAGDGYRESTDRGDTWTRPQEGLGHRYVWGLAVDAGDPGRVLVSAATGARSAHWPDSAETYVYRRGPDEPWRTAMDGLEPAEGLVRPVLASGRRDASAYALTNRGLFRTTSFGAGWEHVTAGPHAVFSGQVPRGLAVV